VSCKEFLDLLLAGTFFGEDDEVVLRRIANTVLLRGAPDKLHLTRGNGTTVVYVRRASIRREQVSKSQVNRRRAAARRHLPSAYPGAAVPPAPKGGPREDENDPVAACQPRVFLNRRTIPSVEEQVGLLEVAGVSQRGFALIRRVFWGGRVGMASIDQLRQARKRMEALPAKQVVVDGVSAHLANLPLAVQERVSALCAGKQFLERDIYDDDYKPVSKTEMFSDATAEEPGVLTGCPPATMKDVHLTVGLDKGGCPASVKIVVGVINQARPSNPNNTILAAVCPCEKDDYCDVEKMLKKLTPQFKALLTGGLLVDGKRRAVRLFPTGDYDALCTVLGHRGASATMPCLMCLSTRSPSREHSELDSRFLTLQDVAGERTLRSAAQYVGHAAPGRSAGTNGTATPSERQLAHLSVELPPLLPADPRQIVSIPLHITVGVNSRLLSLATECVIRCERQRGHASLAVWRLCYGTRWW